MQPDPMEHQGLVKRAASRYRGTYHDFEFLDLVGYGQVGLLEACRRYDPDRGIKFSTYARYWVRREILGAIQDCGWLIREPNRRLGLRRSPSEISMVLTMTYEPDSWLRLDLSEAIDRLRGREQQVVRLRFGLGGPELTLKEVGLLMGISPQRVFQLERRALVRLRGRLAEYA